jgi:hypothetical protein
MTTVAYVPDLMDRSRLTAGGRDIRFVDEPVDLEGVEAETIVVDLGRPGVIDVLPRLTGRVVGFASHVDDATIEAARRAGCDEVLPRSRFFRDLDILLRSSHD